MRKSREEDKILAQADKIRSDAYIEAQKQWYETPDKDKKRPWPRCKNITCNRTLSCIENSDPTRDEFGPTKCEGFDF